MKRSRLSEKQTIAILPKQEAGQRTAIVSRCHEINDLTRY